MSHFVMLVLLNGVKPESVCNETIEDVLAPYSENIKVAPYKTDCWCIGSEARAHGHGVASQTVGLLDDIREAYWLIPEDQRPKWEQHIKAYSDAEKAAEESHPMFGKPDPKCEDCKGTGKRTTTYNPNSKWDWWVIGGRWQGLLLGDKYDAYEDPRNKEKCWLCNGTGKREDGIGNEMRQSNPDYSCNGCGGKGTALRFTLAESPEGGNVRYVRDIPPEVTAFGVVDPEGFWHERGKMGWFGVVSDKLEEGEWKRIFHEKLQQYKDCVAVVVDCHI